MPSAFVVKSGLKMRSMSCAPIPAPVSDTDTFTPQSLCTSDFMQSTRGPSVLAIDSAALAIKFNSCHCRKLNPASK